MECTLCEDGTVADIEEAIEEGWMPSFWVDEEEYGCVCPTCIDKYLEEGMDGEWELKPELISTFRASSSSKMSDKLFDKLKVDIEMAMNHLDELQKLYRKQTGISSGQ
jgi:hypothetical protein